MLQRNQFNKLKRSLNKKDIDILIGARQVGKSTLMKALKAKCSDSCRYLNLENPLDLAIFNNGYESFLREVSEKTVFIDEFHYYPEMTSLFKAVWDLEPDRKIIASGSSSLEMHRYLKESLAGRKKEFVIYPFSFNEWLKKYQLELPRYDQILTIELKSRLDYLLEDFMMFGALPGLTELKDEVEKREYLTGIHQTYISKDIKAFLRNESVIGFNRMIEYLAVNNGGNLNLSSLGNLVYLTSRDISRHVEVMTGTFTLMQLKPLYSNKNKEIKKTSKFYLYDQGIINVIINDFRPRRLRRDAGVIIEQFVYHEILKSLDIRFQVKYWRTIDGKEVDFILEKDRTYLPIEVKTHWKKGKAPPGIKAFCRTYAECKTAIILSDGEEYEEVCDGIRIFAFNWYRAFYLKEFFCDIIG